MSGSEITLVQDAATRAALDEAMRALRDRLESAHSERAYREDWARFCGWLAANGGSHPLRAQPMDVLRYLGSLADAGRAKATRARALAVLRGVYGAMVVAGVIAVNPAREVKNPRQSSDPKTPWLTEAQLRAMLADPGTTWIERRDFLSAITLLGTGLRRTEVARLRWESFEEVAGGLVARVHTKGNKDAMIAIPTWLSTQLVLWRGAEQRGPVFPRRENDVHPISDDTVYNAVKRLAARAGLDPRKVTPHAFRRSFATITGQRGVSLEDRQHAMLHASRSTTERYDKASKLPAQAPGEVLGDLVGGSNNQYQGGTNRVRDRGPDQHPKRRR